MSKLFKMEFMKNFSVGLESGCTAELVVGPEP
jgi:hypothetical protein